jgi:phosphotransferase system enzyme I (PtsP)
MVTVAAETGRGLCICGEMASDPACFALLVGLGLREFSVSAPSILPLKAMLAQLDQTDLVELARRAMQNGDGATTRQMIDETLRSIDSPAIDSSQPAEK